jgi:DNA-binding NtrC family response regulator
MSTPLPPVLVVDDEKNMRVTLESILEGEDYAVEVVESAEEGLARLQANHYLMIITDARLGGMSGYDFLRKVRGQWPDTPVLMITAYATPKMAVEAIKAGAIDYLAKPFAPEELLLAVARCGERHRLLQENAALRARAEEPYRLDRIIGDCPSMCELKQQIQRFAPTDATVLILGESGTGKELIAGALHSLSRRHTRNYVRINCAAIPEPLLESELFGHEKGAFTSAHKQKPGRVEEADGGTIFLDEIGDMSRSLQAKLLRFLEDGTFSRVGGNEELQVNVRLIAATNRDVIAAIHGNEFREDLYHRLNVVQLRPIPLRERGADVLVLASHFLAHFSLAMNKHVERLSPDAERKLMAHHWPGNVRELRNVVERAVILETGRELQAHSIPDFALENGLRRREATPPPPPPPDNSLDECLAGYERQIIQAALERNHFNIGKAAEELKVTRHALRYRMNRLNMSTDGSEAGNGHGTAKEVAGADGR